MFSGYDLKLLKSLIMTPDEFDAYWLKYAIDVNFWQNYIIKKIIFQKFKCINEIIITKSNNVLLTLYFI